MIEIVAAAMQRDGLVISLPRPARHSDVLERAFRLGVFGPMRPAREDEYGFLTNEGLFVNREAAAGIAISAGQVQGQRSIVRLTTKDVW